ncbi:MAG: D-xylose ABC transporter ATP-binding protein [Opitutales bacterium TMED158]|nr:MAG: D-xylose ABC transporter ATP-binding protein [Opitutales bacterium TMED158]
MPLLELKSVSKSFGPVQALKEVSFDIHGGEVVALIGENGAGKSTLMNLLGGMLQPDSGSIRVDGQAVAIHNAKGAERLGISFVHQELNLLDNLDIAGNLFLGREPSRFGRIDNQALYRMAKPLLDQMGLAIEPHTALSLLTNGQRQMVEIAKALSMDARLLILDEPTSSLTLQETDTLLALIRTLKEQGIAIIFITHRLAEVEQVADRVVALRDGENAGKLESGSISRDRMISLMIGRELSEVYPQRSPEFGRTILKVDKLSTRRWPEGAASFEIRSGEILGMAGLVGAGRSELAQALFGVDPAPSGSVSIDGAALALGDTRAAIQGGVFLAPEDRKASGLVLEMTIRENMSLNSMERFRQGPKIDFKLERRRTNEWLGEFGVKAPSAEYPVGNLSGGNQQKVVLAKWMTLAPKVMIFDEPTRGIDMGARHEIYLAIAKLAEQGCAILMISSDMEELLGLSDRIAVMSEGHLSGILEPDAFSEAAIMNLAVQSS